MSRTHAAITVCAYGVVVEDLRSKNGVWVDGERLRGSRLLIGSHVLRIGRTMFQLVVEDAGEGELSSASEVTWRRSRPARRREPVDTAERPSRASRATITDVRERSDDDTPNSGGEGHAVG